MLPVPRSFLDYDSSLTDKETVMLVEEVVLLAAFAVSELKRLLFIESIFDSIKVRSTAIKWMTKITLWGHLLYEQQTSRLNPEKQVNKCAVW